MSEHVPDLMAALEVSFQRAVTDAAECRRIGVAAYEAWRNAPVTTLTYEPKPGDLVLEVSTAFRWIAGAAPGEALGWLIRTEHDEKWGTAYVLRPIFEPNGVEFKWANCKFIPASLAASPDTPEEGR